MRINGVEPQPCIMTVNPRKSKHRTFAIRLDHAKAGAVVIGSVSLETVESPTAKTLSQQVCVRPGAQRSEQANRQA